MGIFDFFKRNKTEEEKEILHKGLEKTKTSFLSKLSTTFFGRTKIDEDFLDDLEETLVSADVGIETTLKIIKQFEGRVAKDKYTGVDDLNRILKEEISNLLQSHNDKLKIGNTETGATGGRSGRAAGLSARRYVAENRSLSAPAV